MDKIFLYDTKTLKSQINTKIFVGDNLITKIKILIPDNIGGYPKRECEFNLRAIIPEGNLSYMIEPSQPYFYITNDITEKAQTVKLMMIITHEGNVIGRTNTVDLVVNEPAEAPDPPLTPREEFDEVIAEQRAEIVEQAETISEQATAIEAKDGQISELNGQVTGLEAENAEQAQTITRQNTTIDELNRRVPPLQTLNPINPSQTQRTFNPESPNIGFPQVIVNPPTAKGLNFDFDNLKEGVPFLEGVGTYNPFPEQSYGGIYATAINNGLITELLCCNLNGNGQNIYLPITTTASINKLIFRNCENIAKISTQTTTNATFKNTNIREIQLDGLKKLENETFANCYNLKKANLLNSEIVELKYRQFANCTNLKTVSLSNTITVMGETDPYYNSFYQCSGLEFITLEENFNANYINFSSSTLYSVETIVSWLEALADRTGQTAYTLTIGTTNINKLTAEQKAIATNKNWNLA